MDTTREKSQQYLPYKFSDQEKKDLSEKLAQAIGVKADAELRLKEVAASIKGEIAKQDAVINDAATKFRQGYEYRNIHCTIIRDFDKGTYKIVRDDTGEMIVDRLLSESELQLQMVHE